MLKREGDWREGDTLKKGEIDRGKGQTQKNNIKRNRRVKMIGKGIER